MQVDKNKLLISAIYINNTRNSKDLKADYKISIFLIFFLISFIVTYYISDDKNIVFFSAI